MNNEKNRKMNENIRYRIYKTSINIFFISIYSNSKVYEIKSGKSSILPGIKYSIITILFGWWGFGFPWKKIQELKNSLTALHINFSGGEDYTKVITEMDYEEKTVWVYNNLKHELFEKTNIETIDIIIDLQTNSKLTLEGNIIFIIESLKKLNIVNLRNSDIEEIINKIKQFDYRN